MDPTGKADGGRAGLKTGEYMDIFSPYTFLFVYSFILLLILT
jgi:hypothetical protein